jgi:hypothetical protein
MEGLRQSENHAQTNSSESLVQNTSESTEGLVTRKPLRPVVEAVFRMTETGGTWKRIVTVKYNYVRSTRTLKYAAVIWRSEVDSREQYHRKAHNETLNKRFENYPVVVRDFADNGSLDNFQENIRKLLFGYGCKNRPSKNGTKSGQSSSKSSQKSSTKNSSRSSPKSTSSSVPQMLDQPAPFS